MLLPRFVNKDWGWEYWFANVSELKILGYKEPFVNETAKARINYCGKLIYVEHNKWSSHMRYHYHKLKDETFFVLDGILFIDYVVGEDEIRSMLLNPLQSFRIEPLMKHKFTSLSETGCRFIEVSTFHSDEDTYRCEWDTKNGGWKEVK
jgi:mannose-6-phosphate isomerase-like protein (cupin superfamily)